MEYQGHKPEPIWYVSIIGDDSANCATTLNPAFWYLCDPFYSRLLSDVSVLSWQE